MQRVVRAAHNCREFRPSVAFAIALALSACSSVGEQAGALGTAGKEAAGSYTQFYTAIATAAKSFRLYALYESGPEIVCAPGDQRCLTGRRKRVLDAIEREAQKVDIIRKRLRLRIDTMKKLGETYDAFLALNDLKVREDFEKKLGELTNALDAFAKEMKQDPLPKFTSGFVSRMGGIIIELVKAEMLRESSARIRQRVEVFARVLQSEVPATNALIEELENARYKAVSRLWQAGALRAEQPIATLVEGYPVLVARSDRRISHNPRSPLSAAVDIHLGWTVDARKAALTDSSKKLNKTLADLVEAHRKFESGDDLKLGDIVAIAKEVQGLIDVFKASGK